ncbi:efflux transporter periplasmic adaptor subunit [Pseudidiomarina sediminum]|uniref:Efflux transporter periplasmic adaptor subunit n=1 Tax=Pseudidiomarina sediminum TaxID=431675 RepID=A0A432Z3S9_9GAMM|nr:HlyD family efflux transporter periplasmic adaptor subunit [Pseudidiomarina sediminum]RUO72558.1 efflux transporter periplasmic adaptor subunit [Pseudidiomarina sediminum]
MEKLGFRQRLTKLLPWLVLLVILAALALTLRPKPPTVATVSVYQGDLAYRVGDEGRTHLRNTYQVSSPIQGYLRRVTLEPGDPVQQGETVFQVEPSPTPALDMRTREQAQQTLNAAKARLNAAIALAENSASETQLANNEFQRIERLHNSGLASTFDLERAQTALYRAQSSERSAQAAVTVARAEVSNATLVLEVAEGSRSQDENQVLQVPAPVSGTVLQRFRCCEGVVTAGETIVELGNLNDLEIQVDLLSSAAVKVRPGMPAEITQWGGEDVLAGTVRRVNPSGFTKVSALGIEEQRVSIFIELDQPTTALGHDYRVTAAVVVEQAQATLAVPVTALFRQDGAWQVFVVQDEVLEQRTVDVGFQSGIYRQIRAGLSAGEQVVNHPDADLRDGASVQLLVE